MDRVYNSRRLIACGSQGWPLMLEPLMTLRLVLDGLMITIKVTVLHPPNVKTLTWRERFMWEGRQESEVSSSLQNRDFRSDQIRSVTQSCPTLCDPMNCSTPGLPVHHQLWSSLRLTSIESVMPSSQLIHCRPLLLLPSIPPSIRVFSKESTLSMRWPKYWSFSFSIMPSKEIPGLISFRMNWLDLLALQGTLKSLFQHHSSKISIFWLSAFFTVQLTSIHDY